MKRIIVLALLAFYLTSLFTNEIPQQVRKLHPAETIKGRLPERSRDVPDHEFLIEPTDLMMTYYDYMPGSYNGIPICVQPEISQPGGYEASGVYIVFHAQQSSASTRKTYCVYIDNEGNVGEAIPITEDIWNGFPGIDIDPYTADAFVALHQIDGFHFDVLLTQDLFHILGETGYWREPYVVIDNLFTIQNPSDEEGGEFIWPIVQIGPSPIEDYRRIYILGKNAEPNPNSMCANPLLAYADFDFSGFDYFSDWTYIKLQRMDKWGNGDFLARPFYTFVVSDDGKVAIIGHIFSDVNFLDDHIFVLYNDNYAEGDFEYYSEDFRFIVYPPEYDPYYEYYFSFINCSHFNAIFTDNNEKIRFIGTMGYQATDGDQSIYWPYLIYPKEYSFDLNTNEFSFFDIYPQGANPHDDTPMLPWDLDEDGIVDSLDNEGNITYVKGWPIYFYDNDEAFHENNFKIVKNEEKNWLAAVWSDGLKAKLANDEEEGYEDWLEAPEIAICISNNNGETWSEPIFLNSLETPELADMIPCYIYPGDLIEDLGNEHGKLHLFFLDDYCYGSYMLGNGLFNGGMLKYAALDIDFGYDTEAGENEITSSEISLQVFPNPFHSSTTISFSTTNSHENALIEIYNIKGQRIREIGVRNEEIGMNRIVWDGRDNSGKSVSSGIYFYQLQIDKKTVASRKCILIR